MDSKHKRYYLMDEFSEIYLTHREFECARALMQGHTAKNIAKLMHISHRTAEAYLDRLKYKFDAATQSILISKLIRSKLFENENENENENEK